MPVALRELLVSWKRPSGHLYFAERASTARKLRTRRLAFLSTTRDGLPKFKDFPKDFGGTGEMVPE
jgi:hypothetical protein